jgi:hypothetical protein
MRLENLLYVMYELLEILLYVMYEIEKFALCHILVIGKNYSMSCISY